MRIDILLKYLCLVKSRAKAKTLCEKGLVMINARPAGPSSKVCARDRITLEFPERTMVIELTGIPSKQASKRDASKHYRVLVDRNKGSEELDEW